MNAYPDQATSSAAVSAANAATVTIEVIMIAEVNVCEIPVATKREDTEINKPPVAALQAFEGQAVVMPTTLWISRIGT